MNYRLVIAMLLFCSSCRPPASPGQTVVSGTAVLVGPIIGAHVRVMLLGQNEVIGDGSTDSKGQFEIPLANAQGDIIIEVLGDLGGTTVEPVSEKPIQLSYGDVFANVMSGIHLGQTYSGIIISPWTQLLAQRVLWDSATNKKTIAAAIVTSAALFSNHFGGLNFLGALPLDPAAGSTNGLSAGAVSGFITSALAVMGDNLSTQLGLTPGYLINADSLTQLLSEDIFAEGVLNGLGPSGPITILGKTAVSPEYTRAFLGAALGTFATSAQNLSGVSLADLTSLIVAITSDTSVLYGNSPAITTSQANGLGTGPQITISSPTAGSELQSQVLIAGSTTSSVGVAGIDIYLDGNGLGGGQRQSVTNIIWALSEPVTDGFHSIQVNALDSAGQTSSATVAFSSDSTPPTIGFVSCYSYDDRARSQVPTVNLETLQVDWFNPSLPDSGCTQLALSSATAPYVFHTYEQLAESASTASSLVFSPIDTGVIFTPQDQLVFTASIYRQGVQIGQTVTIPPQVGTESRTVTLSSDAFGAALLNVSATDTLELQLNAVDAVGNVGTMSLYFSLDLLPTPLWVQEISLPTTSPEQINYYSFSSSNAAAAFDPSSPNLPTGLFAVGRFTVTNVSDQSIAFSIPVTSGSTITASYNEWVGFVAGEQIEEGTDTNAITVPYSYAITDANGVVTGSPSDAGLPPAPVPPHYSDCYNSISGVDIAFLELPGSLQIADISGGVETCINPNSLLTTNAVGSATSQWAVALQDANGHFKFVSPNGDYTIVAGQTLTMTVGFAPPVFPVRTPMTCPAILSQSPAYYSPFSAGAEFSDFVIASGYTVSQLSFPFGIPSSATTFNTYGSSVWSGLGWSDCSGVSCGSTGCRNANNEFVLRVQGVQTPYNDQFIETGETNNGQLTETITGNWRRQAWAEYASFALSRLTQPNSFTVAGSASVTTASHLLTDPDSYAFTFQIPTEQFSVSYSSTNPIANPPSNQSTSLYTTGTLQ